MRAAACAAAIIASIVLGGGTAHADPPDANEVERRINDVIESYLSDMDFQPWNDFLDQAGVHIPDARWSVRELIGGNPIDVIGELAESGASYVKLSLRQNLSVMLGLLAIIVFSAILQRTAGALDGSQTAGGASLVLYLAAVSVIGWTFLSIHTLCGDTVHRLIDFFDFLFPVMMTLLSGTGGLASAAGMQPVMLVSVGMLASAVDKIILPLILASAVLTLLNHMSIEKNLSGIIGLLKSLCKWTMGTVMTVLTAAVSIQGLTLAGYDGISIRTAKYTVDAMVPVVGGMFSDLVELMVAGSAIVKNAVGTLGFVTLMAILAQPLITLVAYMMTLRMDAALAGPLGAERIGKCLEDYGSIVLLWVLTLLIVALFLFLMIFLIVAMGNAIVMYR